MLYHVLQFKVKAKKVKKKTFRYSLYILAHNSSGYDTYVVLNNLPQWRAIVNLIKNG